MEIQLISPTDGAQSEPLQHYCWPLDETRGDQHAVVVPVTWDALSEVPIDRSVPRPLTFRWAGVAAAGAPLRYALLLATDPAFRDVRRLAGLSQPYAEVRHLLLGTRYYWKVQATLDGTPLASSPTWSVTTHAAPPRWIHVPGITNVRDLGGWPLPDGSIIRQGLCYRSSEMNAHLHISEEGKRLLVDELGIRTDVDLREASEHPCPVLDASRVCWVNVPVHSYEAICADTPYGKPAYRRLFALLADAERYPLLLHCWGGADRAGTAAFLLGALLGMRLEELIQDYELTSLSIWGPRAHTSEKFAGLLAALRPFGEATLPLQQLVARYLTSIGVTEGEIASIRQQLIATTTLCR